MSVMGRTMKTGMLLVAMAVLGCYRSAIPQEDEVTSETDSPTDPDNDTLDGMDSGADSRVVGTNDRWPILECVYKFHVQEQMDRSSGFDALVYMPAESVGTYFISFMEGDERIVMWGPNPFDSSEQESEQGYQIEGFLMEQSTEDAKRRYDMEGDLFAGAVLLLWKGENDGINAQLDFLGSGIPIVESYRGYLTGSDCGPPPL